MSYQAGEALWLARLRGMEQFNSENSGRGNWKLLNTGKSDHYAILTKGVQPREKMAYNTRVEHHQTIIQLWHKYLDDGPSYIAFTGLISATLAHLDQYRIIGDTTGTIIGAEIRQVDRIQQIPADAPTWMYAELLGEWDEEQAIAFAE